MVDKERKLFGKIIWFEKRVKYDFEYYEILQPQRVVSEDPRYRSGLFYSEKCNRQIQYESRLELEFIKRLEKSDKVKFYYEQPVQVQYRRGRRKATYTPDFLVFFKTNEVAVVEVKDLPGMLDYKVQMKTEALLEFCSKRGFGLLLTDGRDNLDKIRKVKCNRKLEKAILKAISDKRVLRREECKEILKEHNCNQKELLKVIAKNNLKFKSRSFSIQEGTPNKVFRHVFIEKKPYKDLNKELYPTLFK